MWTRSELKLRAKMNLKKYFWPAFLVSWICGLFNGSGSSVGSSAGSTGADASVFPPGIGSDMVQEAPNAMESILEAASDPMMIAFGSIIVVALVIGIVLSIFLSPIFEVGKNRFYMESRALGASAGIGRIGWGFKNGYLNIVWTMFLRGLICSLGAICCVIPGIYFAYCYHLVPYILAENPDMKAGDALRLSKDMMNGHKWNLFVLELSFIGWWILGALACGVGILFVTPYYDATLAELYAVLRQNFSYGLNGFGGYEGTDGYYQDNSGYRYGPMNDADQGYGNPYESQSYDQNGYDQNSYNQSGYGQNGYEQTDYTQPGYGDTSQVWPDMPPVPQAPEVPVVSQESKAPESTGRRPRGYYLNGEFHPYTEEELNQLDNNQ